MRNRNTEIRRRAERLLREGRARTWGAAVGEAARRVDFEIATGEAAAESEELDEATLEEATSKLFATSTPKVGVAEADLEEAAERLFHGGAR